MNTMDFTRRRIVCTQNTGSGFYFPNAEMLEIGKEYTLVWINIYADRGNVFLKEFPGEEFSAMCFKEVEGYQPPENEPDVYEVMKLHKLDGFSAPECRNTPYARLQAYMEKKGCPLKMIFKGKELPKLSILGGLFIINLVDFKSEIDSLSANEMFVIGRDNSVVKVNKKLDNPCVSRVHAYVVKSREGFEVYDLSKNGTIVVAQRESVAQAPATQRPDSAEKTATVSFINRYAAKSGRTVLRIYSGKKLPKLNCAGEVMVDLAEYKSEIKRLSKGEAFTIGRDNSVVAVNVKKDTPYISRIQAYVTKGEAGKYEIYDLSANGTEIVESSGNGLLSRIFRKG